MPKHTGMKIKKTKTLHLKKRGIEKALEHRNEVTYCTDMDTTSCMQTPSSSRIEDTEKKMIRNMEVCENPSNNLKVRSFNNTMKLSENPLDVFNDSSIKIKKKEEMAPITAKSRTTDDLILSSLKRTKLQCPVSRQNRKSGVFNKIKIVSKEELAIPSRKYYKFPFDMAIVNDESALFYTIKEKLVTAFSSAYSNYKKFREPFHILLSEGIFHFSNTTTCSLECERLLKLNDIQYSVDRDLIQIHESDVSLVYDVIMNVEIPKGRKIPFILSEFEFDNGMVFRTKLVKGPVVRTCGQTAYAYDLIGPLNSTDFHFQDNDILEYLE